ncbi:MAG: DUF4153 domain-containing protein [Alphaproteobacteria bacterium]|nr:DUF4153 domain-containing protein [Alphaproteobacteria bacterium]
MSDTTASAISVPPPANDTRSTREQQTLGIARLIAGAVQGIALYLLYLAIDNHAWPSNDPYVLAPLIMVFVFVPLLYQQAVGTMRPRTLMLWMAAATVILAVLAWYDIWRQWKPTEIGDSAMTFALVAFSIVALFIAQSLIAAADAERKWVASYPAYFDAAWKQGVQLALAAAFVGTFWAVLWLGAVLFNLINLSFIERLIEKSWFAIPATTLAIAAAMHVTDVRARLVAGIRTVALTLLSWLLPLMTLIAVGFIMSQPFTGLAPLWATKSATGLLLAAAGVLVILINAAFQDGDPSHNRAVVLRYSEIGAALALVPLALIATYALSLRVGQHGWTVERIATAATIIVALCYAFGYAASAVVSLVRGGTWMHLMTQVNIATAFVVLGLIVLLFSPIADPTRLAVNSQIARLRSGAVSAQAFDYNYLQQQGGRFGHAALEAMARADWGKNTALVQKLAKDTLAGTFVVAPSTKSDIARNITVYPSSRALPRGFVDVDWKNVLGAPICLTMADTKCDAVFGDFDGDGDEEVLLISGTDASFSGTFVKQGKDKTWTAVGSLNGYCAGMLDALRKGDFATAPPPRGLPDLVVLGVHLHPSPVKTDFQPCPQH